MISLDELTMIKTFLEEYPLGISDDEFKQLESETVSLTTQMDSPGPLFDLFSKTKRYPDRPEVSKYLRTIIRKRIIEVILSIDPANPPEWLVPELLKRALPHYCIPVVRRKLLEIEACRT